MKIGIDSIYTSDFKMVIYVISKALDQRADHLECWRLLAEMTGSIGNIIQMRKIVSQAMTVFDSMDTSKMSKKLQASIYHQLATSFLSVSVTFYYFDTYCSEPSILLLLGWIGERCSCFIR